MLILLDIDGVMVPAKSWKKPEFLDDGFPAFSEMAVQALTKIITETGATILLTSSHKSNYSVSQWHTMFKHRGINADCIERLPGADLTVNRKDEILKWHQSEHDRNENFVIIDDDKLLNGLPGNIKENLVLTSSPIGLTDELADNAISILKRGVFTYA